MTISPSGDVRDNDTLDGTKQAGPTAVANGGDGQGAHQDGGAHAGTSATDATAKAQEDVRADDGKGGKKLSPDAGASAAAGAGDEAITNPPARGQTDASGCEIQNIFSSTRQFVIYEADNQIRIMLPANYNVAKALRLKIADLGGLRASIEDLRAERALSPNEKVRAAREIAWALAQAFEDESDPPSEKPKEILTRVDARLRSLVKSHYRKKYVLANLVAFGAIEALLLFIAFTSGYLFHLPGNLAAVHRYAIYGVFGGLGAFLSVITGIRSVDVDINLKGWEHIFAGATRILIGVVGALVVSLALDSGLMDPTFGANSEAKPITGVNGLNRQLAMYLIFAFIGGFSESLVPNLLRRGEQAAGASDRQNTASDPIVKDMKP